MTVEQSSESVNYVKSFFTFTDLLCDVGGICFLFCVIAGNIANAWTSKDFHDWIVRRTFKE